MTAVMSGYMRMMDAINIGLRWILAAMLLIMTVLIGWQVFARFVVGDSLTFSEEISRFLMVWLVLVGSAVAARHNRLMKVDILETVLSGRKQTTVIVIAGIVSIIFYLVLVVFGFMIVGAVSYQSTPATEISMSIPMAALPVGGLLLVMNTLAQLFGVAIGEKQESEVEEIVHSAQADDAESFEELLDTRADEAGGAQTGAETDEKKEGDQA